MLDLRFERGTIFTVREENVTLTRREVNAFEITKQSKISAVCVLT